MSNYTNFHTRRGAIARYVTRGPHPWTVIEGDNCREC